VRPVWVVLVFDGKRVEFAPELYVARQAATDAAERWAWILASEGQFPIRKRGVFEWMAGFRHILMAWVGPGSQSPRDCWIGLSWDEGCYPTSADEVVAGFREATDWVGSTAGLTELLISPWEVASGITGHGSTRRSMASKAKVISCG
jgi:hypothetical protein